MWLYLAALGLAVGLGLWFAPVDLALSLRQEGWRLGLALELRLLGLRLLGAEKPAVDLAALGEHLMTRWQSRGDPLSPHLQETVGRVPVPQLRRVLRPALAYLVGRLRCRKLRVDAQIGGQNAAEAAVLAGAVMAAIGAGVGQLSRVARTEPHLPAIRVIPCFDRPIWRVDAACILRLRWGEATVAMAALLWRAWKEPGLLAWLRDSWRRKEVRGSG